MAQTLNYLLVNLVGFLPQLLAGLVVMLVGVTLAKTIRKMVVKVASVIFQSTLFKQTPMEKTLKSTDLNQYVDEIFGNLVYWLVFAFTVYVAASVLGLVAVTGLLSSLFAYGPRLISALIVLLLGTVVAGLVEKVIKNALSPTDVSTARATAKISSYTVMIITILIALSEIGIAREFILIAFIGLVTALALAFGLAVGLGGKELVTKTLTRVVSLEQKNKKVKK